MNILLARFDDDGNKISKKEDENDYQVDNGDNVLSHVSEQGSMNQIVAFEEISSCYDKGAHSI
jgi:hypothetical protein